MRLTLRIFLKHNSIPCDLGKHSAATGMKAKASPSPVGSLSNLKEILEKERLVSYIKCI